MTARPPSTIAWRRVAPWIVLVLGLVLAGPALATAPTLLEAACAPAAITTIHVTDGGEAVAPVRAPRGDVRAKSSADAALVVVGIVVARADAQASLGVGDAPIHPPVTASTRTRAPPV